VSELKARLTEAMKQAMRAKEKMRLGTIRMALAAVKQREVDERIELDDAQVLATLDKLVKQRREAEAQYRDAGRDDLADTEAAERDVLSEFLPEPLSDGDLDALIQQSIQSTGAESMRDMGKVMAELKPQVQGRTDMGALSARVKAQLTG
jgi:uncharacterized protein YqeY